MPVTKKELTELVASAEVICKSVVKDAKENSKKLIDVTLDRVEITGRGKDMKTNSLGE